MSEKENGWYLRSDGYMTSKCSYQRIEAMKGNRALDNHGKLVFVKFMGGEEVDSRVYVPHPGTCEIVGDYYSDEDYMLKLSCGDSVHWPAPNYCPSCGKRIRKEAGR